MALGASSGQDLLFYTNGTNERMRIDSGGDVLINHTNSSKGILDVASDSDAVHLVLRGRSSDGEAQAEFWSYDGSTRYGALGSTPTHSYFGSIANTHLFFQTNGTERMRIGSAGNVGINCTSTGAQLEIKGGGYNSIRIGSTQAANTNKQSGISMNNYEGNGTSIFQTFQQDGDSTIYWGSADSGFRGVQNHYFMVNTNSDSTTGHTTAMRIANAGQIGIGRLTTSYKLSLISDATVANGVYISAGTGSGNHALYVEDKDGTAEYFAVRGDGQIRMGASGVGDVLIGKSALNNDDVGIWLNGGGTSWFTANSDYPVGINRKGTDGNVIVFTNDQATAGSISVSGTSTSYNTSSDYRLKEDLQDFNGLEKVSKIPVYNFKWKIDDNRSYGVMAHELQKVLPQAVVGEKDAEEMQSVDYSKIVPLLVKSIQELKAEVDKLKQECKCK
jgi:hypothetical protein